MPKVSFTIAVLLTSIFFQINAQEPIVGDNPPAIVITPADFEMILDSIATLKFNLDIAEAVLNSFSPDKGFKSSVERSEFFRAAAQLKRANVKLFSYLAKVDPENKYEHFSKARTSKHQYDLAMGEYYKSLPSEDLTIQHTKLTLSAE